MKPTQITTKTTFDVDGNITSSNSTAKEIPKTQHSGYFMIFTDKGINLLKPLLNGDAGRVLHVLLLNIDLEDGLIHLTQKQICNALGYKKTKNKDGEKIGKPIVSKGIKKLIEIEILRRIEYKNQICFVLHPGLTRNKVKSESFWKEAGEYEENQKQKKSLNEARKLIEKIRESNDENVDMLVDAAMRKMNETICDQLEWESIQELSDDDL